MAWSSLLLCWYLPQEYAGMLNATVGLCLDNQGVPAPIATTTVLLKQLGRLTGNTLQKPYQKLRGYIVGQHACILWTYGHTVEQPQTFANPRSHACCTATL